ncbi:MAG: DNA polymerase IV [Deltaproteobacteria bacterium]|nr:DNA polymerase IV [Deltaproteobacteria bacterium]MDZ4342531.1 DNA polymerase IV [Candidatus Binatia bacterium]
MSWYLHIDMDAFFASVEQVLDPSLKGKPVIVGGRNGRGVVTSASYAARKFGIHSAMPGFQAKKLCPHGIFLPNRRRVYAEFSAKVFAILGQYSPEVRALSIDEGIVDLTGTERLFGPPLKTAEQIIRRIESELGLPSSGGVSTSRVTAKIAATLGKPRGLVYVPSGSEADFLAPLAVEMIPGVGPKTHKTLLQHGIKTIGDLLQKPELAERYLDLSEHDEPKRRHDHSIGNETTLDKPLKETTEMEGVLWELVEEVGGRLRKESLYARCLTVKIRYTDFHTFARSRTLSSPTCFDKEIFEVVSDLLRQNVAAGRAVRLLGVSASALQSTGWQEPLLNQEKRKSFEKLYQGIDDLRLKYGEDAVGAATPRNRTS